MRALARIVHVIVVAGIVLVLLKANPTNSIISDVHDVARWVAGPFDGIFSFHSARVALAVNWGLAAVVYLIVGGTDRATARFAPLDGETDIPSST